MNANRDFLPIPYDRSAQQRRILNDFFDNCRLIILMRNTFWVSPSCLVSERLCSVEADTGLLLLLDPQADNMNNKLKRIKVVKSLFNFISLPNIKNNLVIVVCFMLQQLPTTIITKSYFKYFL